MATIDDEAADRLGPRELPAIDPVHAAGIPIDFATQVRVFGFRQCRAAQAVFRNTGIELAPKDSQRRDGITGIGTAAVSPLCAAIEAIDMARLLASRFAGAGVKRTPI